MTNVTTQRRGRRDRLLILGLAVALVAVLAGLGGATVAASAGGERLVGRPRTLLVSSQRIWAFALGASRITWISHAHVRGRVTDCGMYVRTLRTKRISVAPLPNSGCGVTPPHNFAAQEPVLASGVAAWVTGSSCGNVECGWKIATVSAGERHWRVAYEADVSCAFACDGYTPQPALAGAGNLLVYSAGLGRNPDPNIDRVRRIVGRHTVPFAVTPGAGNIEQLIVGGGAVEAISRVLEAGDGCGCFDSPVWSPDGSKIAYLDGTFSQVGMCNGFSAKVAVMNADGSGRHDIISPGSVGGGCADPVSPSWSPDGAKIAYEGSPDGTIWVANADGSGASQLGLGYAPAWSPDGSQIAFAGYPGCGDGTPAIFVMNADGTNAHVVASFPAAQCLLGNLAWSPDGSRITFSLGGSLEVMNADGSNIQLLGRGRDPSWSPDGSEIVFADGSGLAVIGADGSNQRQLTTGPDDDPSWSPDGKTIVFSSDRNDPYVNAHERYDYAFPELYLVGRDGSDLRPLSFTKPAAFKDQATFYSPNGKPLPSLPGVPSLAGNIAAVGSVVGGVDKIALFNAKTGRRLAVVRVGTSRGQFAVVGANKHWIVFHTGRTISALNVHTHKVARLAKAAASPLDLSVSGRRVAWAENINRHGRIRAVELPS